MTTLVVITSPDTNMHRIRVRKIEAGHVTEEHILQPGQSTSLHVWGVAGAKIEIDETMIKDVGV